MITKLTKRLARRRARTLAVVVGSVLLGGCAAAHLSEAVSTVAKEMGESQDRQLLLNVVRRSQGHPLRFASLNIVRDRNRVTAGANLTIPFGRDAPTRFDFNPNFSLEQRPQFEMSPQNNQEFYDALLAPISTAAIKYFLQQDYRRDPVLFLTIDKLRIRRAGRDETFVNDPQDPQAFARFQSALEGLIDQGLTAESMQLVRDVGPPFRSDNAPDIGQLVSIHKEGLTVEELGSNGRGKEENGGKRTFQVRQLTPNSRFCFESATEPLFREAACSRNGDALPRYAEGSRRLFSPARGTAAVFDAGRLGALEIYTRSLAEVIDYVGALARSSLEAPDRGVTVRSRGERLKLFVLSRSAGPGPVTAEVEYQGVNYAVPPPPASGLSGEVLSILAQLLGQAQSVKNLPSSSTVTLIGG